MKRTTDRGRDTVLVEEGMLIHGSDYTILYCVRWARKGGERSSHDDGRRLVKASKDKHPGNSVIWVPVR
jgi:hypothetical protein